MLDKNNDSSLQKLDDKQFFNIYNKYIVYAIYVSC